MRFLLFIVNLDQCQNSFQTVFVSSRRYTALHLAENQAQYSSHKKKQVSLRPSIPLSVLKVTCFSDVSFDPM